MQDLNARIDALRIQYGALLREANHTPDRKSANDRYKFANLVLRQIERAEKEAKA